MERRKLEADKQVSPITDKGLQSYERIRSDLEDWLSTFSPEPNVVLNRDGTIIGEVRIVAPPSDLLPSLEDAISVPPHDAWVTIGGAYVLTSDWREINTSTDVSGFGAPARMAKAYPQPGKLIVENLATAIEIDDNMQNAGHEPEFTVIRVAWSPDGKRPAMKF